MFKAARWRSKKNRIRAVLLKLQFKATQVPLIGWESMTVTLVPADVGRPSTTSDKAAIVDGECQWLNPIYETVKFTREPKTGRVNDKVYQLIVSATGFAKSEVVGGININFADYAELLKPTSVSLPLQDSNNGAILHVTVQSAQGDVDGRKTVENGEIAKETTGNRGETAKLHRRTLQTEFSKPEKEEVDSVAKGVNDAISAKVRASTFQEGSFIKFSSNKNMLMRDDSSFNLRKFISHDGMSASGSESRSGQFTPEGDRIKNNTAHHKNASSRSHFSNNDTAQNASWMANSTLDAINGGSTNSSGSENTLEKQESDLGTLARQLAVSDLELQTLRKQVVKERRRGQDLSREMSSLIEERDALRKECEELKASTKTAAKVESISAVLQLGAKDPWSMLEAMKEELVHEKNLNVNLRLQLQKMQESNSELIFAVSDLEEMLEQKNRQMSRTEEDPQEMEYRNQLIHLRNSEIKRESFETASYHEEDQCRLDVLIKERDERVACSQEKEIRYLSSQLELYEKDREDLEMQTEQIVLDYEILKQENHYISLRLEQIQLREQLRMQCECSTHSAIVNELEAHVESLEMELERQSEEFEDNLATIIRDKVEQEQRAIQAEEELRKTRWKNANAVEQLQNEFKKLSSQLSSTFYANEETVIKMQEESRELRLENCHLKALLDKNAKELSSLQSQQQVKCQQLLSLIDFKTREVDRPCLRFRDEGKELDNQKKPKEERQDAFIEEMPILKAEMGQWFSGHAEEKHKLVAEIEILNASAKEIEKLLRESNLEKDLLRKELSTLKEEAEKSSEELKTLRHLKDEHDEIIKDLKLKVETITTQYTDLKHSLSSDELEKVNLRKQVCLSSGDLKKEADIFAIMAKRLKDNDAKLTIYEGTKMVDVRNKSIRSFQAADGPKMVASLNGNSKSSDVNHIIGIDGTLHEDRQKDDGDTAKNSKSCSTNGVEINEGRLQEKLIQDKELLDSSHDGYGERVRRKTEGNPLVPCAKDGRKISEAPYEVAELNERNETMEAELKEMQKRYLEMSLKFAEAEGERQQLLNRIQS